MLERASSCLEPASQLFLRRLDPPLRSSRVLGPSFWKNGGDDLHLPPWWSAYLNSVRSVPQPNSARKLPIDGSDLNGLRHRRESPKPSLCRPYTNYGALQQSKTPVQLQEEHEQEQEQEQEQWEQEQELQEQPQEDNHGFFTFQQSEHPSDSLPLDGSDTEIPFHRRFLFNDKDDEAASQHAAEISYSMGGPRRAMQAVLDHYRQSTKPPDPSVFHTVKILFRQLPEQGGCAAQVMHLLSRSRRKKDLIYAVNTFSLIPFQDRTPDDYTCVVRASMKSSLFGQARRRNSEATSRQMNHDCSAALLVHCVSQRFWKIAIQVWKDSYHAKSTFPPSVEAVLLKAIETSPNIPTAILELGNILKSQSPIIASRHGFLAALGRTLLRLFVSSGPVMSNVTPKGLLQILEIYSPTPNTHCKAIDTLLKSAKRSDRGALSLIIYRHLRSTHPDFRPSRAIFGALISIHRTETAPIDVLTYLLDQFTAMHQAADLTGYQGILVALSEQGAIEQSQKVFMELCRVHGRPKDPAFYTPLMYAYARLADFNGAKKILDFMQVCGVEHNTYSWNILLYAYVRAGKLEEALQHFETMIAQGVTPDAHTFGTLMSIHSQSGNTNEVLKAIELAQDYNIEGNYEMIAGLVHSYCRNDEIHSATKLAAVTTEAGLAGSPVKMWNHILKYLAFRGESEKVLQIQQQMKNLGVAPDDMTYAALMTALIIVGKTADATRILRVLNISNGLVATRFHYAIVLQGYVLEDDRDMAHIIYKEMLERFPGVGPSARLSMLQLEGNLAMDASIGGSFGEATDYLMDTLSQMSYADRATKEPQPGFRRRKAVDGTPSVYILYLVNILLAKGRLRQADKLMKRYSSLEGSSYLHLSQEGSQSIEFLNARLSILTNMQQWSAVEEVWAQILTVGLRLGLPIEGKKVFADAAVDVDAQDISDRGSSAHNFDVLNLSNLEFTSMVPQTADSNRVTEQSGPSTPLNYKLDGLESKVLFPQRFLLGGAITNYLNALDQQKLHRKAIQTVQDLEAAGFSLTSKNLNFYIQMLSRSSDTKHKLLAFEMYEEKLLPNTPPWPLLRRGLWKPPSDILDKDQSLLPSQAKRRKVLQSRNPGQLVPTYWTTVYLAAALQALQRGSGEDNLAPFDFLWKNTRGTFEYIRRLPFLRDRIQGVLLRGRSLILGDPQKRLRHPKNPDRAGLLESLSPVDQVPADEAADLEEIIARIGPDLDTRLQSPASHFEPFAGVDRLQSAGHESKPLAGTSEPQTRSHQPSPNQGNVLENPSTESSDQRGQDNLMQHVERFVGPLNRSAEWSDRTRQLEDAAKRRDRIRRQERKMLETVSVIRRDIKLSRVMSSRKFGRPSANTKSQEISPSADLPSDGHRLYNLRWKGLETVAESREVEQNLGIATLREANIQIERTSPYLSTRKTTVPQMNAKEQPHAPPSKLPSKPYDGRSLRVVKVRRVAMQAKLGMKLKRIPPPNPMARAFSRDKALRERDSMAEKEQMVRAQDMTLEAQDHEREWKSDQQLVYNTLDEQVELNRMMKSKAQADEEEGRDSGEMTPAQAHKLRAREDMKEKFLDRAAARKAKEAKILVEDEPMNMKVMAQKRGQTRKSR